MIDVSRHIQLCMSKYKKNWRYTIHYVKPTAQLLFKSWFPKGGPTCRRQVVNPWHQTPQGQSVAKPETPLQKLDVTWTDPMAPCWIRYLVRNSRGKNILGDCRMHQSIYFTKYYWIIKVHIDCWPWEKSFIKCRLTLQLTRALETLLLFTRVCIITKRCFLCKCDWMGHKNIYGVLISPVHHTWFQNPI